MTPDFYLRPSQNHDIEYKVKKSRFIAHLRITRTESEAKDIIREISFRFRDASHNCWAYRFGYDPVSEYYSDAGEPSGTAGKPILTSIQRYQLSDTLIVVTRYFGGIKLGVRGLIEAYGIAASLVIDKVPPIKVIPSLSILVELTYPQLNPTIYYLSKLGIPESHVQTTYADKVTLVVAVPLSCSHLAETYLASQKAAGQILNYQILD